MGYQIRSNGVFLNTIAPTSEPAVTWRWGDGGGGLAEVSWEMVLPYDYSHPDLSNGALIEVMDGASPVGRARLTEPGRTDTGLEFNATGIYRDAEHYLCLKSGGDTTTVVNTAVDQAIARGLAWTRPVSMSATAVVTGDTTEGNNYLNALLDAAADELGKRWWVDGKGAVRFSDDPTTPLWHLVPGLIDLTVADDSFATYLVARYLDGSTFTNLAASDAAAEAKWGRREYPVDLLPLGSITGTRAAARLAGLLKKGKARPSFVDRVDVTSSEILTADGAPAPLSMVRAGDMVRAHGLDGDAASLNGANYIDFVLGEVVDTNSGSISLAPVALAARTLADTLAIAGPAYLNP